MTPTTSEREAREILEATAGGDVIVTEGGARAHINLDWAIRAVVAALTRQEPQQEAQPLSMSMFATRADFDAAQAKQEAQGAVTWKDRARDMLNRLITMQPPNVVLQQVTMLGEARSIIEAALAATSPAPVDVRQELERVTFSRDFYMRRCEALQAVQNKMRDPERKAVCDILANGSTTTLLDGQPAGVDRG